jgi:hypothetical protein
MNDCCSLARWLWVNLVVIHCQFSPTRRTEGAGAGVWVPSGSSSQAPMSTWNWAHSWPWQAAPAHRPLPSSPPFHLHHHLNQSLSNRRGLSSVALVFSVCTDGKDNHSTDTNCMQC